jgi:hypothetical protein
MVRVNGELLPFFTPSRGLGWGDPMPPYLSLFCAYGFTLLLKFFGGNFVDRGIRVSFRASLVKHLLFADNNILYLLVQIFRVHIGLMRSCRFIINDCSGQRLNKDKSATFFTLGISVKAFSECYLGLLTVVGRIKSGILDTSVRDQEVGRMVREESGLCCKEGATEIIDPVNPYIFTIKWELVV